MRHRDAEDNRLVRVYLTTQGRAKERSITEQFTKLEAVIFEAIDTQERVHYLSSLEVLLYAESPRPTIGDGADD